MRIINIIWDLNEGDSDYALPKKINVPNELIEEDYKTITNWVFNMYGWRICSCDIIE